MLPKGELKSEELSMCRHGPERAPETFVTNLVKLWTLEANQLVTTPTFLLVTSGQTRNSPYLHTRQNSPCVHSLRGNFHVHQRTWCDTGPGPSFYNPVIYLTFLTCSLPNIRFVVVVFVYYFVFKAFYLTNTVSILEEWENANKEKRRKRDGL